MVQQSASTSSVDSTQLYGLVKKSVAQNSTNSPAAELVSKLETCVRKLPIRTATVVVQKLPVWPSANSRVALAVRSAIMVIPHHSGDAVRSRPGAQSHLAPLRAFQAAKWKVEREYFGRHTRHSSRFELKHIALSRG